ncbi:MAG: G/U mismatch-specific uracil DNA glycosylase [uncultured Corynebacteriales bacterium]|uniref:G/U mismatch-specific uracil DNA glycosylase n=1 Tax=uncultured Mycobacteriales bacterium TaxID=581187 RepID=A0A6J4HZA7_9ACTN|nr:MAG: G/U mismatch-specific uracil DNA glycosylase [uncultured Corynebacteriales bacterium]
MAGPTKEELAAAYDRAVPDLVAPGLRVLFVGINPSLWSGWSGYHFGRPSNRLWITLHEAGFTDRRLRPEDTDELLAAGIGITNLVNRATARADELTDDEIRSGLPRLAGTVATWHPRTVAVLGITAYRTAFGRPKAVVGPQPETLGESALWVLPNPSGLNAHYQQPALTAVYAELRGAVR